MKAHIQLNETDFAEAVKNSDTFKNFEQFKKNLIVKRNPMIILYVKYCQACRYGIDYIKQNPNIMASDIAIIKEIIETK